jgi:hypothetical protein
MGLFSKTKLAPFVPIGERNLWTMATPKAKPGLPYYPEKSVEKLVINMFAWKSSTHNGVKFLDPNLSKFDLLLNGFRGYGLTCRGQHKAEARDPINISVRGLVGPKPLIAYKKDKGILAVDESETADRMHKHQLGNIHGVSTASGIWTPLSFSAYLAKEHEIAFFSLRNIPEIHRRKQVYDNSRNPTGVDGDTVDYSGENEWTLSAAHVSCIPFRVVRKGGQIHLQANPLYVDLKTLTPELEKEYSKLLEAFYKITDRVRLNPVAYVEEIIKFQVQQNSFYSNYAAHLKEDPLRCSVIEEEVALPKLGEELTFKA